MTWTDARIAQLARLWSEGVSAAGIAEALGEVSRKPASAPRKYHGPPPALAMAGAGLPAPSERPAAAKPAGPPAAAPEPPRSPWREAAFAPLAGTTPRPWLSREFGECAFPVAGDGDALVSCCAAVKARSAYCAAHHGIVFKPVAAAALAAEQRRWTQAAERWAA